MRDETSILIGRNPVTEALRAGKTIDRLFIQQGLNDGPIQTILRLAKKTGVKPEFVPKQRLDEIAGEELDGERRERGGRQGDSDSYNEDTNSIRDCEYSTTAGNGINRGEGNKDARGNRGNLNNSDRDKKERIKLLRTNHQGVIAYLAAYRYYTVEDILETAREKGEEPFIFVLDGIEDPHNLGAMIRTANLAGAHGVIIRERRAVGLTSTVAKASAGAIEYTKVAKVTNIGQTIDELKEQGLWFVCADMDGTSMYDLNLRGPIGLVIGNEGEGVSRLVSEKCDMTASIPMHGDIDSLNASVACGVLAYEIVRQRHMK